MIPLMQTAVSAESATVETVLGYRVTGHQRMRTKRFVLHRPNSQTVCSNFDVRMRMGVARVRWGTSSVAATRGRIKRVKDIFKINKNQILCAQQILNY